MDQNITVMKSVRIAVSTVRYIEEADSPVAQLRIQEILSEHRTALIAGVLDNLPAYLGFKIYAKVDKGFQRVLKDKLLELSHAKVSLDRYSEIVEEIKSNASYKVPVQPFFIEIDRVLDMCLNPPELSLID
jgi:hypothetical protein